MSKLPSLGPSLTAHLVENRRQMQRQAASSSFARSGMSASAEGETTVDGNLIIDGNLEVSSLGRLTFPAGGSLLMKDTSNRNYLYAGGFTTAGFGLVLYRLDGSPALTFSDIDPLTEQIQIISLTDRGNKALISEDVSGAGASWPLAPIVFSDLTYQTWPSNTTATFTGVQTALQYKSSPRIYVSAQAICDGTATGEVRLMCNGIQVGATVAVPNLAFVSAAFGTPAAVAGAIGTTLQFSLDTRVTAGAGACRAKVFYAVAWPS